MRLEPGPAGGVLLWGRLRARVGNARPGAAHPHVQRGRVRPAPAGKALRARDGAVAAQDRRPAAPHEAVHGLRRVQEAQRRAPVERVRAQERQRPPGHRAVEEPRAGRAEELLHGRRQAHAQPLRDGPDPLGAAVGAEDEGCEGA